MSRLGSGSRRLLAIPLTLAVLVACVDREGSEAGDEREIARSIECRAKFDCLLAASTTCAGSRATISSSYVSLGADHEMTWTVALRGVDDLCEVTLTIEKVQVALGKSVRDQLLTKGTTSDQIEQVVAAANARVQESAGQSLTCRLPVAGLRARMLTLREDPLRVLKAGDHPCSGSLVGS